MIGKAGKRLAAPLYFGLNLNWLAYICHVLILTPRALACDASFARFGYHPNGRFCITQSCIVQITCFSAYKTRRLR